MATTVNVDGIGQLIFPDGMSEPDMLGAIQKNFPNWNDSGKGVVMDSFSRFGRETAKAGGEALSGIATLGEIGKSQALVRNLRSLRSQSAMAGEPDELPEQAEKQARLEAPSRVLRRREESSAYQLGQDIQESAQDFYKPNPASDNTVRAKLIQGIASTIPVVASGPLAPITYAGMMGEHGAKEAEKAGASPRQIVDTFLANAALGVTSEYLLGVPYLLRSIKAFKGATTVSDTAIGKRLANIYKNHPVASLAVRGSIAEGIQEGPIEQTGQNAIAKWVGQYDPDRPIFKDVAEQAAYGAAIGLLFGAGFGAASNFDLKREQEQAMERLKVDVAARASLDPRNAQLTRIGEPVPQAPLIDFDAEKERLNQQDKQQANEDYAALQRDREENYQRERIRASEQLPPQGDNRNVATGEPEIRQTSGGVDQSQIGREVQAQDVSTSVTAVPQNVPFVPVLGVSVPNLAPSVAAPIEQTQGKEAVPNATEKEGKIQIVPDAKSYPGGVVRVTYRTEDGKEVGYGQLDGKVINMVTVNEPYRRQGVGTAILADLRKRGGAYGVAGTEDGLALMRASGAREYEPNKFTFEEASPTPVGQAMAPQAQTLRDILLSDADGPTKARQVKAAADAHGLTVKQAQEAIESALVKIAHEIAIDPEHTSQEKYERLLEIYQKQPTLSARTSTSVANQAYSTPTPLAYALGYAIDVKPTDDVYDPTAGNGMLLINGNFDKSHGNELNIERLANLVSVGVGRTSQKDATQYTPGYKYAKVMANPPFGGISTVNWHGYAIKRLEHVIALRALEAMRPDGQAAIILGAKREEGPEQFKGAQWVFENFLYGNYNVVANFEVEGDLYAKQGASWPVRVLVIDGKRATPVGGELAPKSVVRLKTWDEVAQETQRIHDDIEQRRSTVVPGGQAGLPVRTPRPAATSKKPRKLSRPSERPAGPTGQGVQPGGTGGRESEIAERPSDALPDPSAGGSVLGPNQSQDNVSLPAPVPTGTGNAPARVEGGIPGAVSPAVDVTPGSVAGGALSSAAVPGAEASNTLVDSQPLIDAALNAGGGDSALKALVPNVRIVYGALERGVLGQYFRGTITLNKPVADFIATKYPDLAPRFISHIIAHELTHAVAGLVLKPADYVGIAAEMSGQERKEMLEDRPEIAEMTNVAQQLYHIGAEFFAKRILSENEQALPIDPNSTFGQRILAALQKIWDYLAAALKRLAGRNSVLEQALYKVRKAKADVLAGKLPVFEQGDALNAKAIKDALAKFEEDSTATRELGMAQAGELVAASPVAQDALETLRERANISKAEIAANPEQASQLRMKRAIAQRVLRIPFVKKNIVTQVDHYQAASNALNGDLETFARLQSTKGVTLEEIKTAAGNAFDTLQMFSATKTDLFDAIDKRRPALVRELAKTFERETEALHNRDVYSVLFKDFQNLGRQLMRMQKDVAVLSAYKQATNNKPATRNVLKFIHDHMDFSGMTFDDLRSVEDLWQRVRLAIIEQSGNDRFKLWNGSNIAEMVGASEDAIRAVLRIVALSEPIRTELEQAKVVAAGTQYTAPFDRIKTKLADQLKAGNYDAALALYEKGIADTAISLKESRDAANFYTKDTRRILINIKAIDAARDIANQLSADPELTRQANEIYKFHNIARVTHGVPATGLNEGSLTTISFKRADPADAPIEVEFSNTTEDYQKNVEKAKIIAGEYQAYIVNDDVEGYDPRLAAGMEKSMDLLARFLDPAQDPKVRGRLVPTLPVKAWDWFSAKLFHFATIPKYITAGTTGHLADIVDLTMRAYSTVVELSGVIRRQHDPDLDKTLKAAMLSHGDMVPGQYHLKVLNPLAASRQNFNNAGILKPGDAIGNGEVVTAQDMAYLRAVRSFETALYEMQDSTGNKQFASVKAMFIGILFDNNGQVRSPITHGPDMTGRDFPPEMQIWSEDWFKNAANRIAFLDHWKDPLLIGYVRGSREVDWRFGYAYPEATRAIARELNDKDSDPLANFEDLVDRIFEHYHAQEGVEPRSMVDISADVLNDFDKIFTKLKPIVAQGGTNPKTEFELIGGSNSFNTPRSVTVMPPGWYNYGVVTAGDRAGTVRQATLGFQLAHIKAVRALRDSLAGVVERFEGERKNTGIGEWAQLRESKAQFRSGDILYSLGEAKRLLQGVDHWLEQLITISHNSANAYVKDSVHMTAMRGGAQLVITSIVSGTAAVTKNVFGGYQNLAMLDVLIRRRNVLLALPTRGAEMISQGLKELAHWATHTGNPATAGLRKLLESQQNVTFIGDVAKFILGHADRQRQSYVDATRAGVNYNINLWAATKGRWKFRKTLGVPQATDPPWYMQAANQISFAGNTAAQYIGQATVGKVDVNLNTRMMLAALPIETHFRDIAIEFGDKMEASGLFPDKSLGLGWWGNDLSAARIRDLFRQSGVGPIDGIMADFYQRWTKAKADEQAQGLPEGTLSEKERLFSDAQFNQLEQALTEDNNATYANRPAFFKMSEAHSKFSPLWGYPTWFIQKLLHLTDGLSNKGTFKNLVDNMPTLIQIAIAMAIIMPLGYGLAAFLKRFFENKVTGFPTVFDAQNPKQAAQAILAATADSIPFIGTALNMVTGAGYRTGFDINSQFLMLNLAGDAMRTYKEVVQSGDLGGPMQRFAGRYIFPLNVVGAHAPNLTGLREFTNAKNILVMGARGTGLETKLRRTGGGGGSDANYSASTPIINRAMNALGKNDMAGFQAAYQSLVEQKRSAGSLNPGSSALTALRGRSPLTSVFGTKLQPEEMAAVYSNVSPALAERARSVIDRFDRAIAGLPRQTVARGLRGTRPTGRTKSTARTFGLRRSKLRTPSLRLRKPRLRRLQAV